MCAIALLSGLALILSHGRAGSAVLNVLFIVTTVAVLIVILQGITYLAQYTMNMSSDLSSDKKRKDQHSTNTSSDH